MQASPSHTRSRTAPPRQLELNPIEADGDSYSPTQIRQQAEDARAQAAFFEQQQAEWEEQHLELERIKQHKIEFSSQLDELGLKIHNVVRRIEREVQAMDAEKAELKQIHDCLSRHLMVLSSLDPTEWSPKGIEERLLNGLTKLDRAENDLQEAYIGEKRYRYVECFKLRPDQAKIWGTTRGQLIDELKRGLFFHLPLILSGTVLLAVWYLITHII